MVCQGNMVLAWPGHRQRGWGARQGGHLRGQARVKGAGGRDQAAAGSFECGPKAPGPAPLLGSGFFGDEPLGSGFGDNLGDFLADELLAAVSLAIFLAMTSTSFSGCQRRAPQQRLLQR